jgi:hypothetical protein
MVTISVLAEPPQRLVVVTPVGEPQPRATILRLPCISQELSIVERHVLTCVAVHHWNFGGSIPYRPPTAHQADVASWLAGPDLRLLSLLGGRKPCFRLSRLGEKIARRLLKLVPAEQDMAREREFDRMRALMRNEWEVGEYEE